MNKPRVAEYHTIEEYTFAVAKWRADRRLSLEHVITWACALGVFAVVMVFVGWLWGGEWLKTR